MADICTGCFPAEIDWEKVKAVTVAVIHPLDGIPDFLSRALHPELNNSWPVGEQVPRGDTYKDPQAAFLAELEAKAAREPSCRKQYPLTARDKEVIAELEKDLPTPSIFKRRKDTVGSLDWGAFKNPE